MQAGKNIAAVSAACAILVAFAALAGFAYSRHHAHKEALASPTLFDVNGADHHVGTATSAFAIPGACYLKLPAATPGHPQPPQHGDFMVDWERRACPDARTMASEFPVTARVRVGAEKVTAWKNAFWGAQHVMTRAERAGAPAIHGLVAMSIPRAGVINYVEKAPNGDLASVLSCYARQDSGELVACRGYFFMGEEVVVRADVSAAQKDRWQIERTGIAAFLESHRTGS